MSEDHHKHSIENTSTGCLMLTMALNFIITITELIGGILSGSLSLMSDALHNFSDGFAIIVSYIAIRLNKRPRTKKFTFGLKRAEIIAAIFNASTLIIISFFLIKEAYQRFINPEPISGSLMIIVAGIGLAANVAGSLLLHRGSKESMNIRSVYLHLFGDAISSLTVILGGIFIKFFAIYWIDPLLTVLIAIYVLWGRMYIIRDAIRVVMMAAPSGISIDEIAKEIEKIDGVKNVHHVHIWEMNEKDIHFEAHVEVEDMMVSQTEAIGRSIQEMLKHKFNINHTTLQFEYNLCKSKELI